MIDFMIIGAQKAATSALQGALRAHPEVYMPTGESAYFEEPDYLQRPWETFAAEKPEGLTRGIKRPDYLCSDQAIARISEALPDARFIAVLREPISRAISSYVYLVRHGHLPALPLNPGMQRCIEAYEGRETGSRAWQVVQFGLYGQYLQKWYEAYPRDRFLVLSQKLVSGDPARALQLCAEHIGVDPGKLAAGTEKEGIGRSNVGLYDPHMLRIARIGSTLKTRQIPGTLRREPSSLPMRALGSVFSRSAELLAEWRGQQRETLEPEIKARLDALYDADLALLRTCVDPDIIYWKA